MKKIMIVFKGEVFSCAVNQSFVTEIDFDKDVVDMCYDNPDHIVLLTRKFNFYLKKMIEQLKGEHSGTKKILD